MGKTSSQMSLTELSDRCMGEVNRYMKDEAHSDDYCLEIFRRATVQSDTKAWELLMHRFNGIVIGWVRSHPAREIAYRYHSEENYAALAFARFWKVTVRNKSLEFTTLAGALAFLRACLNSAIIDTLRSNLRPNEVPLPEPGFPEEPIAEDTFAESTEIWEAVKSLSPNEREKRLAYLLYQCGLKPKEVVQLDVSCFWGMRYIISRTLIQEARPGELVSPIMHSSRPHVGVITCHDLEYVVKQEIPTLQGLHRAKRILLSSLRRLKTSERDKDLAEFGSFLRKKLQIVHFACHAREKKPYSQSYLLISDDFDITMEDFGVQEFVIKHNPFVILNACLTGTISPLYTSNWAALFWRLGARGVLATEMHVPDWFAAAFTEELYKHFLSGKPIGKALLVTRRYFWEENHNPLGLAYALYSSPSIRIVN